jgi:hypothetical protein
MLGVRVHTWTAGNGPMREDITDEPIEVVTLRGQLHDSQPGTTGRRKWG